MILDTNALSAFADKIPGAVKAVSTAGLVAIPIVVLGEYRYGIAHSRRERDYEKWLRPFLETCQILEIAEQTIPWYVGVRSELRRLGKPIPANDVWIAALCRQHNLPLLSRDAHFDHVKGLRRVDWQV
jgi:predicted nucleic acid-binding protein